MRLTVTFPQVKTDEYIMPARSPCEGCESSHFHRHKKKIRQIDDLHVKEVMSLRYKCVECNQKVWLHPTGITGARQSQRLKAISAVLYVLGLSYGAVLDFLRASGAQIGKTSSYYNVQAANYTSRQQHAQHLAASGQREAIAADGTYLKVRGEKVGIEVVVDPQTGEMLGLEFTLSESAEEISAFIREVAEQVEAEILISDDFDSYKTIAEECGLAHHICQTHIIRNVDKLAESYTYPRKLDHRDNSFRG
jgi:transposase-like protein